MEQMIILVYDTECCKTEADDPQKAVLFFHPHWVSDQQRLALCGQLMGAAHFCSSVFSPLNVLTLQCGKFVFKKFGRYILSVGSDQTLSEWILQERFNLLELLIEFYQNSFDFIYNTIEGDEEMFSKKLTEILEIYIPILQFVVCAIGNVFVVSCQKKNSGAFLEAFQLLEACCYSKGVLGGVILHNGRVIASQLDPDLTKLLTLTDRFHIRKYAEEVKIPFHLPVGVQLIKIYLKKAVHEKLQNAANLKLSTFNHFQKKCFQKAGKVTRKKKEMNKIFTVHEEDDQSTAHFSKKPESASKEFPWLKIKKSKSKNENSLKERSKNFSGNLNVKVCSTPTVEKTLIHEELVSICSSNKVDPTPNQPINFVPDLVQDAIKSKNRSRILPSTKYFSNQLYRISMDDLMIDLTHQAYPVPLRYYCFGLPKICRETECLENGDKSKKGLRRKHFYKTIADPMNPVFRQDGVPVSKSLYNNCLDEHYKDFITANLTIDSREEFLKNKYLENSNCKPKSNLKLNSSENCVENNLNCSIVSDKENESEELTKSMRKDEVKEVMNTNQKALRKSLSLPLKPLFCDTAENTCQNTTVRNKVLNARTPTTPLTTRLRLLAFEEQIDTKPPPTPIENQLKNLGRTITTTAKTPCNDNPNSETVECGLFVYGCQNMTILLVLDKEVVHNPDIILSLWKTSSGTLQNVENLRNRNMVNLSNSENNNSSYSFLSMDSHWGTVQKSGAWDDNDLKIVGSLQNDLVRNPNITEIIIRNEDSVVYGYSCGGTKIFYQQAGCSSVGLPTPADLMGVVTLKARRRLERDRDVVLL